jgi:hypothetical protein
MTLHPPRGTHHPCPLQVPAEPRYKFARLIAEKTQTQGCGVLAVEVTRPSPATTPTQLAALAKQAVSLGADVIVVSALLNRCPGCDGTAAGEGTRPCA